MKSSRDIIKQYFLENNIIQKKLVSDIGESSESGFSQKLKKKDLDTDLIYRISKALKHDFFADLSNEFEKETGIKSLQKGGNNTLVEDAILNLLKEKYPKVFK